MQTHKEKDKMAKWDPREYAQSSAAQLAWAEEVIGRLSLSGDEHILDIGCGDGKVSALFLGRLPSGSVTGIDSSPEMVRYARETYPPGDNPGLSFYEMDACRIVFDGRFHIVFSNACLHWIENHRAVLRGVHRALKTGGRFIMSCGGRGNAADFAVSVSEVTRRAPWAPYFRDFPFPYFFYGPDEYGVWLKEARLKPVRVELMPKDMVHKDKAGLAAWMKTTWIPYTQMLPEDRREEFVRAVVDAYMMSHPADETGATHVKMVRLEVEAVKE
jgi:trans-aconitate 2-methyltransferase